MQTFLPYPSFSKSAECLDYRRLGKQRVEVLQLLNAMAGKSKGWVNHPAALMWKGYEDSLIKYGLACCNEWIMRGYKDTCFNKIFDFVEVFPVSKSPQWLGNEAFHKAHQSNLLRKDPDYYSQFNWDVPDNLPYIWPVTVDKPPIVITTTTVTKHRRTQNETPSR